MALAFGNVENTDWKYTQAGGGGINVALPTYATGDFAMVIVFGDASANVFNQPAGWTAFGGTATADGILMMLYQTAAGPLSSALTLSFTASVSTNIQAVSLKVTGHDSANPFGGRLIGFSTADQNWTSPNVSLSVNGCILFHGGGSRTTGTFSASATPTTSTLIKQAASPGSWFGIAYIAGQSATAVGTKTWTNPQPGTKMTFAFGIAPAIAASLAITSVNTTNEVYSSLTDAPVFGTGLSSGLVVTYKGIACSIASASGSTSIKVNFPDFWSNNIKLGVQHEFKVNT